MRETFAQKKHLWTFKQDGGSRGDNKRKHLKGATEGQKLMLTLSANAMQMQCEHMKGTQLNANAFKEALHYNCIVSIR